MSYDLFIWQAPSVDAADDVWGLIEEVCENENLEVLSGNAQVPRFLADLFTVFPALEDEGDDHKETPWACTGDTSDKHAMLSLGMGSSSSAKALDLIVELCRRHGLHCFDPQSEDFHSRG